MHTKCVLPICFGERRRSGETTNSSCILSFSSFFRVGDHAPPPSDLGAAPLPDAPLTALAPNSLVTTLAALACGHRARIRRTAQIHKCLRNRSSSAWISFTLCVLRAASPCSLHIADNHVNSSGSHAPRRYVACGTDAPEWRQTQMHDKCKQWHVSGGLHVPCCWAAYET